MSTLPAPRLQLPRFSDRLLVGGGLHVSPFALGMTDSPATIPAAFDAGINFFFFSADMHWPLYSATRQGLADLLARGPSIREQIVVAVVSYVTQPEFCSMPFEEALEAVPGLRRIDLAIAGGAYASELPSRLSIYAQHRERQHCGVRAIGATCHERAAALMALQRGLLDIAFIRYNASHPGAREDVFPELKERAPALVFNFKSVSGFVSPERLDALGLPPDYWRPHPTDHYRFVLSRPELDGVLCSLRTPAELSTLMKALEQGPLSEEEEEHLLLLSRLASGGVELA